MYKQIELSSMTKKPYALNPNLIEDALLRLVPKWAPSTK